MSADTMMIVFGGLLALAAIILKAPDVKMIRAPMIGRGRRPRADVGRGSSGYLGAAHGHAATRARPEHTSGAQAPIEFYIRDHLAADQISEDVRVLIDSREAGRLSVDKEHLISVLPVTVSEPGQHQYTLEVTTLMSKGRATPEKMQRVGQGTFVAAQGKTFRLAGDRASATWSVHMEEEEEEIEE